MTVLSAVVPAYNEAVATAATADEIRRHERVVDAIAGHATRQTA